MINVSLFSTVIVKLFSCSKILCIISFYLFHCLKIFRTISAVSRIFRHFSRIYSDELTDFKPSCKSRLPPSHTMAGPNTSRCQINHYGLEHFWPICVTNYIFLPISITMWVLNLKKIFLGFLICHLLGWIMHIVGWIWPSWPVGWLLSCL